MEIASEHVTLEPTNIMENATDAKNHVEIVNHQIYAKPVLKDFSCLVLDVMINVETSKHLSKANVLIVKLKTAENVVLII
jgi:hypothetical protein